MAAHKTNVEIVFGAMTIGNGAEQSRNSDLEECKQILDIFQSHGHKEIDTARVYGGGTSEEYLAKLNWQERGIVMDTKHYPTRNYAGLAGGASHSPEDLRKKLQESLTALNTKKLHLWYLHGPDRQTPIVDTLREVNNLYKEGLFEQFGISNYQAWEVAQMREICKANGWVAPVVYQGVYNCIHRNVEPELFPCLRHYGMGFYAFNPLGGGFFVGHLKQDGEVGAGSRFDPNKFQGKDYRRRYWNDAYFGAMDMIRPVADKHGLTLAEVALRWMTHHSKLGRQYQDAILIGASSTKHLDQNLKDLEKGALPDEVVEALDAAWARVKAVASNYYH